MWNVGRIVGFSTMLAVLLAIASGEALAQKKKKDANADPQWPQAAEEDYAKLSKNLIGKLVNLDSGSNHLTIRVESSHMEPNPKYKPPTAAKNGKGNAQANQQAQLARAMADLQVQQQRAANARTPREAQQAQQKIAQDMARLQIQIAQAAARANVANNDPNNQPYMSVTTTKDYDLEILDKVTFRKMFLAMEYDDEGNIKKYTTEEKLALKGDDKTKPGYTAKIDEAQNGQEIKLYLTLPKKKAKDADKDKDAPPEEPEHAKINMVVLTKEAPMTDSPAAAPKKKKKDN